MARRIDKRVLVSKIVVIIFAFLISYQINSIIGREISNIFLRILVFLLVWLITNTILLTVLLIMVKFILGRDVFLEALGIEPHDHRYKSPISIFFLVKNMFRLSR